MGLTARVFLVVSLVFDSPSSPSASASSPLAAKHRGSSAVWPHSPAQALGTVTAKAFPG